mgnify:CR=1 FL=1
MNKYVIVAGFALATASAYAGEGMWTPDNLPMGVHFLAAHGGEGLLFRLAGQLEQARPWASRRAPI